MPNAGSQPPTRFRGWKRTAAVALLLLAGGAIVNIAVAWAYATLSKADLHFITREPTKEDDLWWSRDVGERSADPVGAVMVHADRSCSVRLGLSNHGGRLHVVDGSVTLKFGPPQRRWQELTQIKSLRIDHSFPQGDQWQGLTETNSRLSRPEPIEGGIEAQDDEKVDIENEATPELTKHVSAIEATVGVPVRTGSLLFIREWQPPPADPALQGSGFLRVQIGKVPAASRRSTASWESFHKARVLWPGFALNTIFYALVLCALWWLLLTPLIARRMLRRRRGLCEMCAYPVGTWGGSPVCTECGAAVPARRQ